MDVKASQVVQRTVPPIVGVVCNVVPVADDRALPVLYASRTVKVIAIEPSPCPVEHFTCSQLVLACSSCDRMMKLQIGGHAAEDDSKIK